MNPNVNKKVRKTKVTNTATKLQVLHFNCRGLSDTARIYEFEEAIKNIKWDVIGISETRKEGEKLERKINGNLFYYYGERKGYRGTGFYVHRKIANKILEIKGISERISVLKLKIQKNVNLNIIQVYAPILGSENSEIEKFYEQLEATIVKEREYYNIVMGDWNSKLGHGVEIEGIMGPYGIGVRNENGERLIEFAGRQNLKIANTFFNKKEKLKWTWVSPDGKIKNEIDHFLINDTRIVENVVSLPAFTFPSDHRIIRTNLKIKNRICYKNNRKKQWHSNKISVIPEHKKREANEYCLEQISKIEGNITKSNLQTRYNELEQIILLTGQKFGREGDRIKTDDKITENTKNLIKERNQLKNKKQRNSRERIELIELNKTIKRKIREDMKEYEEKRIKEILEESGSTKRTRKELIEGYSLITKLGKRKSRKGIVEEATMFYKDLYKKEETTTSTINYNETNRKYVPKILQNEIEKVLSEMKEGKAAGPDKIDVSNLKSVKYSLIPILTELFNAILKFEIVPEQWEAAEIRILYKKGNKDNISNYRPISLTSNTNKMFMKIIKNRIYNILDQNQGIEQAGFRKNFSTIDHLFTIGQLIEKANEYNIEIHMIFVDFNKAFDSVKHSRLWEALVNQGVPEKWIEIIRKIYSKAKAYVKTDIKGQVFEIGRGVRQGDPMSPNLFNSILEEIFREMNWEEKGYGIKIDGKNLNNLRFADDVVLIGKNEKELQKMFQDFIEKSAERGLTCNLEKTKAMANRDENEGIKIRDRKIEKVEDIKYLGKTISFKDGMEKEIKIRREAAWRSFWALKNIYKNKKIGLETKIKILESCTLPVLSYGAQTWALTNTQLNKLRVTQRSMERSILNIKRKEKVSNKKVRTKSGVKDIGYIVKKAKLGYAGHMIRNNVERWNKRIYEWTPIGYKRRKGKPTTRWRKEISDKLGILWTRSAQNRSTWRKIREAYAQEWAG